MSFFVSKNKKGGLIWQVLKSKELKWVNSLLKLNPKNVELLKQKQDLLTQSITET